MATRLLGTRNVNLAIFSLLTISAIALNSQAYFPLADDFFFWGFVFEVTFNSIGMTFMFWPILATLLHLGIQMSVSRVSTLAAVMLIAIGLLG
ncbi:hypothetical protein [Maricaulis sp.]|uniref:hypothetical protein n=1 Tax=Maricaulis sp. TaxID=1486257 RepID=UPI003A8FAD2E